MGAASEELLKAENLTEVEALETIKKAAYDYRKNFEIDEDAFKECRIFQYALEISDRTSNQLRGKNIIST